MDRDVLDRARDHRRAGKDHVHAVRHGGFGRELTAGVLGDRHGFSSECRLHHAKLRCGDEPRVGGDDLSRLEEQKISRDHLPGVDVLGDAVAHDRGAP